MLWLRSLSWVAVLDLSRYLVRQDNREEVHENEERKKLMSSRQAFEMMRGLKGDDFTRVYSHC